MFEMGTPWMVFMENPSYKWMRTGGLPLEKKKHVSHSRYIPDRIPYLDMFIIKHLHG
jgi:hypothetical protein